MTASNAPFRIIAIDGGAASGKSSTARAVADKLHYLHVDTGTHYRAVTLVCLRARVPPVAADVLDGFLAGLDLATAVQGRAGRVVVNGTIADETQLRSPEVNAAVSHFAALPAVRSRVMAYQRDQVRVAREAGFRGLVMDGRDIGTVIFPDADLKIFLRADVTTRQARRRQEGQSDRVADRDQIDSSRATAPLAAAADAVSIDNSRMPLTAVVEAVLGHLAGLQGGAGA
jgi:cytidylate kinase